MNIENNQTLTVTTRSFGSVSVTLRNETTLHFEWTSRVGRVETGWIVVDGKFSGQRANVPQLLFDESLGELTK